MNSEPDYGLNSEPSRNKMPNKNYRSGRRKEYSVCDKLKKEGFDIAQRSSGSHSPIDVFAINKEEKKIKFIQIKKGDLSSSEYSKIWEDMKWIQEGNFDIEFEIIN